MSFAFEKIGNAAITPGMALQLSHTPPRFWRVTHTFDTAVYIIAVSSPEGARDARRPVKKSYAELESLHKDGADWGRLSMPSKLEDLPRPDTDKARTLEAAWDRIRPLVELMQLEQNLDRTNFTSLIQARAELTDSSFRTVKRLLLRYYYFGQSKLALLPLSPGVSENSGYPTMTDESNKKTAPVKRRGRPTALAEKFGKNDFIVSEKDIGDMVETLEKALKKGTTYLSQAHEVYLAKAFQRRHPEIYDQYTAGNRDLPVTARQFRYYIKNHATLEEELSGNLRTRRKAWLSRICRGLRARDV